MVKTAKVDITITPENIWNDTEVPEMTTDNAVQLKNLIDKGLEKILAEIETGVPGIT